MALRALRYPRGRVARPPLQIMMAVCDFHLADHDSVLAVCDFHLADHDSMMAVCDFHLADHDSVRGVAYCPGGVQSLLRCSPLVLQGGLEERHPCLGLKAKWDNGKTLNLLLPFSFFESK